MPATDWTQEELYMLADRGHALYRQGRYPEAAVIFDGLTTLAPSNVYYRTALSAVCLAMGEVQRAIEELTRLLTDNPALQDARARRCEAYCAVARWDQARQDLAILQRNGARNHVQRLSWRLQGATSPGSERRLATS
jgi:predicted Zn-dependent protease